MKIRLFIYFNKDEEAEMLEEKICIQDWYEGECGLSFFVVDERNPAINPDVELQQAADVVLTLRQI